MEIGVLNYTDSSIHHIELKGHPSEEEVEYILSKLFRHDSIEWMASNKIDYYDYESDIRRVAE